MKKVTIYISILIFSALFFKNANAQKITDVTNEKPSYKYLFQRIETVGLFFSPLSLQFPLFTDNINNKRGFGIGAIVNKEWYLGYYNLNSRNDGNENSLDHNGLWLGYIIAKNNQFHLTPSLKLGSGSFENDNVFVMNPQIGVEMNLFKWAKAEVGLGYQFVNGLENESDLNAQGFYLGVDLKLGWFAKPLFGRN